MEEEVKNRSIRLSDSNWKWLSKLPGRTVNDAVGELRVLLDARAAGPMDEFRETLGHLVSVVGELPSAEEIGEVLRLVVAELKSQRSAGAAPNSGVVTDPTKIPGVNKGLPPRETGSERAARERRERQERARGLDSVDDESFDRSDEFVSG